MHFKSKSNVAPLHHSGVYNLCCNDYNAVYIGQTGQEITIKILEHVYLNNKKVQKYIYY